MDNLCDDILNLIERESKRAYIDGTKSVETANAELLEREKRKAVDQILSAVKRRLPEKRELPKYATYYDAEYHTSRSFNQAIEQVEEALDE
jgi:hypothetical protein